MRVLYITTIGDTMGFFKSFIRELIKEGHSVDIATNENGGKTPVDQFFIELGCKIYPISCSRSPLSLQNIKVVKEIKTLVQSGNYDIVHCHTPIAAASTRLACKKLRKSGLKVFYTAHGFHFYEGAPIKNWILFYPIEKWLSKYTDVIITINQEDYKRATEKFRSKRVKYVPGVGINSEWFGPEKSSRDKIRMELKLDDSQFVLLSVGELNENKNHVAVIKAIKGMNLVYVIVGKGEKNKELEDVAKEYGVDLRLMGFRKDVIDFYSAVDAYILPSIREGLNVSLMEAMASGLPCLCGKIRGNVDLIDVNGGYLFNPQSINEIRYAIQKLLIADNRLLGTHNQKIIQTFDVQTVNSKMWEIYLEE